MAKSIIEQLHQAKQSIETTELDKINKEIAVTQEQKAKAQEEKRQYENQLKRLQQKEIHKEHNKRTHRLIVRGAILEKAIPNSNTLTNEQIQELVYFAFSAPIVAEKLKKLRENAAPE